MGLFKAIADWRRTRYLDRYTLGKHYAVAHLARQTTSKTTPPPYDAVQAARTCLRAKVFEDVGHFPKSPAMQKAVAYLRQQVLDDFGRYPKGDAFNAGVLAVCDAVDKDINEV